MKLRKSDWIAVIITLVFFQLMCLWCIDVSTSTMIIKNNGPMAGSMVSDAYMTNGFFIQNPMITYHLGLYVLVITCFLSALIAVHIVLDSYSSNQRIP